MHRNSVLAGSHLHTELLLGVNWGPREGINFRTELALYLRGNCWSIARFSLSTLTRGSPRRPRSGPSVNWASNWLAWSTRMPRALATRAACARAESGLMCGSRPLPDAVTASAGIGAFALNNNGALSSL